MSDWEARCVLCAARDRQTRLESGHCCAVCAARIVADLSDVLRLCADAAASLVPGVTGGSGARSVPGSKPPINVDAVDPELTIVDGQAMTVLDCLESWERMTREMRGMVPYGPASLARSAGMAANAPRSAVGETDSAGGYGTTPVALTGVVAFLQAQVPWATAEPSFPLEDFADEVRACVRVLRRWDAEAEDRGQVVLCPTLHEDGSECGMRLHYRDWDEQVTCRRCRVTRDAATLVAVAMADGREVWLDPEAAAKWLGIGESTLRAWAKRGQVERRNGRYRVSQGMTA